MEKITRRANKRSFIFLVFMIKKETKRKAITTNDAEKLKFGGLAFFIKIRAWFNKLTFHSQPFQEDFI